MTEFSGKRVAMAISGGVDSAIATKLLKDHGANVTCYFMTCWPETEGCEAVQDYQSACAVASYLNIPLYKLDYIRQYKDMVFDNMIQMLKLGVTPNPDVGCNSEIKFGIYYKDMILERKYDFIATGHYASVKQFSDGKVRIGIPVDKKKDQSYYLSQISPETDLSKIIFPLESYTKSEVRELAKKAGLPNASRHDSQGICFIGDIEYRNFISKYVTSPSGSVVNLEEEVIGTHSGLHSYTIGQRHGFKLDVYTPTPMYVVKKDQVNNELVVGVKEDVYMLSIKITSVLSYLNDPAELISLVDRGLCVRIRSLGDFVPVKTLKIEGSNISVGLKYPIYAPAPGQYCVFYLDDAIVASGTII